jgi:hypothetical protein
MSRDAPQSPRQPGTATNWALMLRKAPVSDVSPDAGRRTSRRRRFRPLLRYGLGAGLVVVAGLTFVSARWYVWPQQDAMPAHVDGIVMLDGPGDRLDTALDLAWAHRAPVIAISEGTTRYPPGRSCAPRIPGVKVICFDPSPATTRGEAEFAARLAARYHWHSIALVAVTPQDTVARLRLGRCFSGKVYLVNGHLAAWQWPLLVVYEWGSTLKALFLQPGC